MRNTNTIKVSFSVNSFTEGEKEESFPKFTYDYLIMQYGLKTIALKNLSSMFMGFKKAL